jgi:gluconolactonase
LPHPYTVADDRFRRLIVSSAQLERLWTGSRWAEGPAYVAAGRYLVWSDIPRDRMLRYDETDDSVSVFRQPCGYTNGHTIDREGRLVSCEHQGRCVSRTEHDGSRTVLVDRVGGARLNSPNDVVVASDGSVWFSDPTYGIDSDYEGDAAASEIGASHVYRWDPASRECAAVVTDFEKPNGLAFSPDERVLYVADTGATHREGGPRHIRRFAVGADGRTLSGGNVFATCEHGLFDGIRTDVHGNLWASAGEGIDCYGPDGALLGRIAVPEAVANLCFGGPKRNRLYICASTSLYAIHVNTQGALRPA